MDECKQNAAWRSIWGDVLKGALIANLAITVGTVGVHAALLKLLNLDDLVSFLHIFCGTAPLAAAVAITVYAAARTDDESYFYRLMLVSAGSFYGATWLGQQCGAVDFVESAQVISYYDGLSMSNAPIYVVNMLVRYYQAYGPSRFISSLAVGGFLAWSWLRVEHHLRLAQAVQPAAVAMPEVVPLKRRARRQKMTG